MLISAKNNFTFLCTPKCASNSIEAILGTHSDIALLGNPAFRHTNYREYVQYIKPYLFEKIGTDDIETICIIREPISWLNSWYRFRSRAKLRKSNHPQHMNSTMHVDFCEFLDAYISSDPPPFANVGSQFDHVRDEHGEIGVETIFAYERLDEFLHYMENKVGKKLSLPHKNRSPAHHYQQIIHFFTRNISNKKTLRNLDLPRPDTDHIPEKLLSQLYEFIPQDFKMYQNVLSRSM